MFLLGMDFSSLEETERLGGRFFQDGEQGDLIEILAKNGINAARLRVWVDPYSEDGKPYGGGTCDLPCLLRLAKRAKGMQILLDLHYSDFWCDPARQMIPKAWRGETLDGLCERVSEYTAQVLQAMKKEGVSPEFVQVGNEITNGMLWPVAKLVEREGSVREGYDALARLLHAGCKAVRENSDAKIVLHLERSGNNPLWREWLDEICARGVDFDILGASYYPFWHGDLEGLRENLTDVSARYQKDVAVVETAYAFTTEPFETLEQGAQLVIHDPVRCDDGRPVPYPLTPEGQRDFVRAVIDLVAALPNQRGVGVFYWEPAWLPLPGSTWATDAARKDISETEKPGGNEWANQCIFDYNGNATPALKEFARAANTIVPNRGKR